MTRRLAWPHVRAALIALHVVSIVVLSIPSRDVMTNRRAWNTPNARAELEAWTARLDAIGVQTTPESLRAHAFGAGVAFGTWRDRVAWPFARYAELTGALQGWQMFVRPQKVPGELHIDVQIDGQWQPLVRPWDESSTWLREVRTHNRVRKLLGRFARGFHADRYDNVVRWFAQRAFEDFPSATAVRARLWRYHSPTPEQAAAEAAPPGHYEHERIVAAEARP